MSDTGTISVLVVEVNPGLREAVTRFLEGHGCWVTPAPNARQALQAVRQQPFDLVVSDLSMPDAGGLWLYQEAVRLRPALRGRFVFTSAEPRSSDAGMSVVIGPEYFLLKPLSLTTLWQRVGEVIEGARRASASGYVALRRDADDEASAAAE